MKFRTIAVSIMIATNLVACNDEKDYSGTYTNIDNPKISLTFQKNTGGTYQAIHTTIIGKDNITGIIKDGIFYRVSDNEKVGGFKENIFIDTNNIQYKK